MRPGTNADPDHTPTFRGISTDLKTSATPRRTGIRRTAINCGCMSGGVGITMLTRGTV